MDGGLFVLLLIAIGYLIYKVHRLEQLLGGGAMRRRQNIRAVRDSKVVPILKSDIEPGPFRTNTRRPNERPPERDH